MFINGARSSHYIASMITAEGNNKQLIITLTNPGPDLVQPAEVLQLLCALTI